MLCTQEQMCWMWTMNCVCHPESNKVVHGSAKRFRWIRYWWSQSSVLCVRYESVIPLVCLGPLALPWSYRWHSAGKRYRRSTGRSGSCRRRRSQTCCPGSVHNAHSPGLWQRPRSCMAWVCTFPCRESWIRCSALKFCCGRLHSKGGWQPQSSLETERGRDREISIDTYPEQCLWLSIGGYKWQMWIYIHCKMSLSEKVNILTH